MRVVTLTTDFGAEDAYVGMMKGVVLGIAPHVQLVDLSHAIPPRDIVKGACVLWSAVTAFPPTTVHLAVVDPGVGGTRQALAVEAGGHFLVGPDNGLLLPAARALGTLRIIRLDRQEYFRPSPSPTFHGRDIFAPVAAHLASGVPFEQLGSPLVDVVDCVLFDAQVRNNTICGRVLFADRFGNLVTNITETQIEQVHVPPHAWTIHLGHHQITAIANTFSDVAVEQPVAYLGSCGLLEIAIRNGSAAQCWHVTPNTPVMLAYRG